MVMPAKPVVPKVTTGGLDTVAVRMPSDPVAAATPINNNGNNNYLEVSIVQKNHSPTIRFNKWIISS